MNLFSTALAAASALVIGVGASAANVESWNVGSGQSNGDFNVDRHDAFVGSLEVGLRASLRQVGNIAPSGNVYSVLPGSQPGVPTRARWNFDYSIYAGGIALDLSNLTSATLTITSNNGTPGGVFDLLDPADDFSPGFVPVADGLPDFRQFIDVHTTPTNSAVPNPTNFYQGSQNPVFAPWFTGFDFNEAGEYTFTLDASTAALSASTEIVVSVVPAPAGAIAGTTLLGGLMMRRRRG